MQEKIKLEKCDDRLQSWYEKTNLLTFHTKYDVTSHYCVVYSCSKSPRFCV